MVLHFERCLEEALERIEEEEYKFFEVHSSEIVRSEKHSVIIEKYGEAKWGVVDLLNAWFDVGSDLYNWLHFDESDEVAYFLNEVGSNCLNYSSFKAPLGFHVWRGRKGFVIGVEQKG